MASQRTQQTWVWGYKTSSFVSSALDMPWHMHMPSRLRYAVVDCGYLQGGLLGGEGTLFGEASCVCRSS